MIKALVIGFVLDFLIGDPAFLPHPVRLVGKWISFLEGRLLNLEDSPRWQRRKGALLVFLVLLLFGLGTEALLRLVSSRSPVVLLMTRSILTAYCLAARDLERAASKVRRALERRNLQEARESVSMIVGRDTARLNEEEVCKAAVESVAESSCDGVIAPLFYLAIGGPLLGMLYKCANTMDSMIGYRNDRYRYFGEAAARLDDVLNFIPARLSAALMIAASFLLRLDARNAFRIYRRDHDKHASPNSAHTESVVAGALRLQLGGDAWYFGKKVRKPTIGDAGKEAEPEDIKKACRIMYVAAGLGLVLLVGLRVLLF